MNLTEAAKLIYVTTVPDDDGFLTETEVELEVLVDKKDVFDKAKFQAMASGVDVSIILELWEDDFKMTERIVNGKKKYADRIEYDGTVYKIINRSTADNSMITRLTCG